jgi:hypothetical protein
MLRRLHSASPREDLIFSPINENLPDMNVPAAGSIPSLPYQHHYTQKG